MKKMVMFSLLLWSMLIIAGCWDIRDISNRAFVTAIGLDAVENGKPGRYKVTFEMIRPMDIKRQSNEPGAIVETVEAESIGRAIEQLQSKISRTITLGHLRVLIIGDKMARQGFNDPLSFFEKSPEVATRLRVGFVQDGQALDILKAKPLFERSVSAEYVGMTDLEKDFSLVRTRQFYNFVSDLRNMNGNGFIARVYRSENGEKTFIREGGAVFKDWKLIGWLNSDETQAANWLTGIGKATVTGRTDQGAYTYQVNKKSARLLPINENGQLRYVVKVITYGYVSEEQGENLDLFKPQNIKKLEEVFSQTIAEQVLGAVLKAQKEVGVDYLGFGKALKQRNPKTYESLNWAEVFPNIPVHIEVDSKVSEFGLAQ